MDITIQVNGVDLTESALLPSTRIKRELSGRVSTAELSFRLPVGDVSAVAEAHPIEIRDETDAVRFRGTVARLSREWFSTDLVDVRVTCADFAPLLDDVVIPTLSFVNKSDREIVQGIAAYAATFIPGLTATNTNVAVVVANIAFFEIKDQTAREALEALSKLTTAEYFLDFDKGIHYFPGGGYVAAPFALSTAGGVGFALDGYTREFSRCINSCTLLGAILEGGTELRETYEDPVSIAAYGKHAYIIVDRDIDEGAIANLKAKALVEANAYPRETATATLWDAGLEVGQTVEVTHTQYDLVAVPFVVRSVEISWDESGTVYSVELGDPAPTTERLLQALDARTRGSKSVPTAIPAAGTVTDESIGPGGITVDSIGTISADKITGLIQASQIESVNATAILGALSSAQIGSINAASITGALTASQIGSVNATSINGVIVSSQVANDLIDSLAKLAPALRPIPRLSSNPALPSVSWPEGSVIFNTAAGTYFKVLGGVWTVVSETTALAGKFEYSLIGTLKASSITGLIAAGQIGSVSAGSIVGTLSASQIGSVNASSITGSITATQISGGISAGQISSIFLGTALDGLGKELLPNGGFTNDINGWQALGADPNPWVYANFGDRQTGGPGTMVKTGTPGMASGAYAQALTGEFLVGDNDEIEHSGWYWTANAYNGAFQAYFQCYDANHNFISVSHWTAGTLTATGQVWRKWNLNGRVPAGTHYVRLSLTVFDCTAGYIHVDDVSIRRVVGTTQVGVGVIQAEHIGSVNASSISGTITAGQIGSVNAASISGTLNSSQIGTISATQISGQISAGQIASINATQITGSLSASQIGSITSSQIASINAATISIGQLQDNQIAAVSAGKLTAGTITATVTMTSPTITGGTIQIASGGDITNISSSGFFVYNGSFGNNTTVNSNGVAGNAGGATRFSLSRASGNGVLQLYSSAGQLFFEVNPASGVSAGGGTFSPSGYLNVIIAGVSRRIPFF